MPVEKPKIHRQKRLFPAVILACVWVLTVSSATACPEKLPTASINVNGNQLLVEVATKPWQRRCGLAHRMSLPKNRGMLFVFPEPGFLSFWMKDTSISLSIAFLDDAGRIISIQKMTPLSTEPRYRPPAAVRYALEVNREWFEKNSVRVGDFFVLNLPDILDIR